MLSKDSSILEAEQRDRAKNMEGRNRVEEEEKRKEQDAEEAQKELDEIQRAKENNARVNQECEQNYYAFDNDDGGMDYDLSGEGNYGNPKLIL
jgi:hypothetical protein